MKTIKGWIPTTVLAATLLFGSGTAHAGIIYGYANGGGTPTTTACSTNSGIIYGLTGIIYGLTGIIYGYNDTPCTDTATSPAAKTTPTSGIIVTD